MIRIASTRIAALLVAGSAFASASVMADAYDGKSNLVCAATDVVACAEAVGCMEGPARHFDMPDFMYVNFERKVVHARSADAKEQVESKLNSVETSEKSLVMQGVEEHQGWTLSVNRASGRMTMSVTGNDASYMVFGACTPL